MVRIHFVWTFCWYINYKQTRTFFLVQFSFLIYISKEFDKLDVKKVLMRSLGMFREVCKSWSQVKTLWWIKNIRINRKRQEFHLEIHNQSGQDLCLMYKDAIHLEVSRKGLVHHYIHTCTLCIRVHRSHQRPPPNMHIKRDRTSSWKIQGSLLSLILMYPKRSSPSAERKAHPLRFALPTVLTSSQIIR